MSREDFDEYTIPPKRLFGCFCTWGGVLFVCVLLIIRAILFGVDIKTADFEKLAYSEGIKACNPIYYGFLSDRTSQASTETILEACITPSGSWVRHLPVISEAPSAGDLETALRRGGRADGASSKQHACLGFNDVRSENIIIFRISNTSVMLYQTVCVPGCHPHHMAITFYATILGSLP